MAQPFLNAPFNPRKKPVVKPQYLYYLIPLTMVFVCFFAMMNYMFAWKLREIFKLLLVFMVAALSGQILSMIIPFDWAPIVILYIISIIVSIRVIKEQEQIFEELSMLESL